MSNKIFTVKDIALIGLMAAMLETVKIALQSIPNVELVTFLIIMFTIYIGPKMLLAVWAFVGMECFVWGLGLWTIMYIYIWPILVILTLLLRKYNSIWAYSALAICFGLFFGALCSIPYFFIGGPIMAINWWIAGIPYDILHGVSNGIVMFVLYKPTMKAMQQINRYIE